MDALFFRVEHDLLRSEAFQTLGGSAIKVYLIVGLYSDFGTGWAYPSIRTIAKQAGLSRQTVLAAIDELSTAGLLTTHKAKGRSSAYKVIRQAPERPGKKKVRGDSAHAVSSLPRTTEHAPSSTDHMEGQFSVQTVPDFFRDPLGTVPNSFTPPPEPRPNSFKELAQFFGPSGPAGGPERDSRTREETLSIPIPGTPFHLTSDGRLQVAVDVQELLTENGIPRRLAERLAAQKAPEDVAKVLLNALYLQSQGKLQNGPGYIRAGIEDGYDLLPQVASRLETRRKELEAQVRIQNEREAKERQARARAQEEAAIELLIRSLSPDSLDNLIRQAVRLLPEPMVRRNPTLSNPFVRGMVYELAGGEPLTQG